MLALQRMNKESFPLHDHIVNVNPAVDSPDYLEARLQDIPLADPELIKSLDASQQDALDRIITKKLAIVQGPPGTGKTHVSVAALRSILSKNVQGLDPPIIVSCQTNHALDQILTHIAEFEPEYARLGSQSKDEKIKRRTPFILREDLGAPYPPALGKAKRAADAVGKRIASLLNPLKSDFGPISHKVLSEYGIMSEGHAQDVERSAAEWVSASNAPAELDVPMAKWAGKHLSKVIITPYTDMMALPVEEVELEFEMLLEAEAENMTKDEEELSLKGYHCTISDNYACKTSYDDDAGDAKVEQLLAKCKDLDKIPGSSRPQVYTYYQRKLKQHLLPLIRSLATEYAKHTADRRIGRYQADAAMLRNMKVVGLTTTGLSKYRALLHALQPKIILIEEAAETKEAPVASACLPSLQHLILVGDHKQLRPQCHWRHLAGRPWYLDVSMFERLMDNKIESTTLAIQRRMIPEIRRSIWPIYRDKVLDHPSVSDLVTHRPPIPGMGDIRTFFYSSCDPELLDEAMSPFNPAEADMLVGMYNYLYQNGVEARKITILTFYNGQRKTILRKLVEHPNLRDVRKDLIIRTVDSYQGEENDIVLLSLVRSNEENKIGFLANQNRACVALSRAKRAMYIFGNAGVLVGYDKDRFKARNHRTQRAGAACLDPAEKVDRPSYFWSDFLKIIAKRVPEESSAGIPLPIIPSTADGKCRLVEALPIVCRTHGTTTFLDSPAAWLENDGGCNLPCQTTLDCGHPCPLKCHSSSHDGVHCQELCDLELCCGHICKERCQAQCRCDVHGCSVALACNERDEAASRQQQYVSDSIQARRSATAHTSPTRKTNHSSRPGTQGAATLRAQGHPGAGPSPRQWQRSSQSQSPTKSTMMTRPTSRAQNADQENLLIPGLESVSKPSALPKRDRVEVCLLDL